MTFEVDADTDERGRPATDRFGVLLLLLSVTFLVGSVASDGSVHVVAAVLNALVLVASFRATGLAVTVWRFVAVLAVGVTTVTLAVAFDGDAIGGGVAWVLQAVVLAAIAVAVVRRVLVQDFVGVQTILGAICAYVLLGLIFGSIYGAFDAFIDEPALKSGSDGSADPLYYSFVTLTTVGFGDVTSSIDLVRRVTIIEALFGQVFLATMIARLVSMFGTRRSTSPG